MLKKYNKVYIVGIPIASVMLAGSIILLIIGYQYNRLINAKEFIDIASESVAEAYRLIVLAERYIKLGYILLIVVGCVLIGIVAKQLISKWLGKNKEQA